MRALFACNKWRHIMIDLVESRSSLRIKGKSNERAIPLCPLASLDRKQSYGDVHLHLPFGHVMVPSKSQQRNESLGKWTRPPLFLFWTPRRWQGFLFPQQVLYLLFESQNALFQLGNMAFQSFCRLSRNMSRHELFQMGDFDLAPVRLGKVGGEFSCMNPSPHGFIAHSQMTRSFHDIHIFHERSSCSHYLDRCPGKTEHKVWSSSLSNPSLRRTWMNKGYGVWGRRRFQGSILPLTMLAMHLWIIQLRRWRFLARQDRAQQFCISLEQSVDGLGHLTGHATDHPLFPDMGLRAFVIRAFRFDQSLIQLGPFVVPQANGLEDDQKQHLLHRPGPSACQSGAIIGGSCLFSDGRPTEVRFEGGCRGKIVDRADGSDHRGSHHRSDPWERQEDLPFPCLFNDAANLTFQLVNVLAQKPKLFDQLPLVQQEATKARHIFDANALRRQPLQLQQLRIGEGTGTPSDQLKGGKTGSCKGLWRGKLLAKGKRDERIGIFHDAREFWKDFVADRGELVLALGPLTDQFISVTDQSLELSCGLRWRHNTSDQVQFVGDLDTQLKLTVEVIRQGQRVPFVRFEHPARPTLHVHDVDGDVQLLQVLLQGTMIVPRALHEHENLFQRSKAACPLHEHAKPLARIFKHERRTGLKAIMTLKERLGEEACDMGPFADVNTNIQGLIQEQRNCFEVRTLSRLLCHRSPLLRWRQAHARTEKTMWVDRSEPVEVPLPSTAEGFLVVPTDISGVPCTSPTESQGICSHYVKRGLRTPFLGERLPSDLSISILTGTFVLSQDLGSLCQGKKS